MATTQLMNIKVLMESLPSRETDALFRQHSTTAIPRALRQRPPRTHRQIQLHPRRDNPHPRVHTLTDIQARLHREHQEVERHPQTHRPAEGRQKRRS